MSRTAKADVLEVGGEPRVDLLPPELLAQRKAIANRRRLGLGVVLVVVLTIAGVALASFESLVAQANLASEQSRTQSLVAQQKKFIEARKVQDEVSSLEAAQEVGTSTEIDWKNYLTAVQATLPANVVVTIVTIDSASPLAKYAQSAIPLQGARVATLSFTALSATLPEVPAWLDSLTSLPGYTDASPGSVTRDDAGIYTVNITMHINEAAFTKRFAAKGK